MLSREISIARLIRLIIGLSFLGFQIYYIFFDDHSFIHKSHFFHTPEARGLNYLLLLLFIFEFFCCLRFWKDFSQLTDHALKFTVFISLAIIIVITQWVLIHSPTLVLWSDELSQFSLSFMSPLFEASRQHQMPLGYYQSYMSGLLFDDIRFAVRIPTILNFSFGLAVLFLLVKSFTQSLRFSLLAVFLCCTSYCLLYHAADARPQSLSFLYQFLLIFELRSFCLNRNFNFWDLFSLFSLSSFFLLSLGFQPPLFLGLLTLFLAIYLYRFGYFSKLIAILSAIVAGYLVFFPFQWVTIKNSSGRFHDLPFTGVLLKNLSEFNWLDFSILRFLKFFRLYILWNLPDGFFICKNNFKKTSFA